MAPYFITPGSVREDDPILHRSKGGDAIQFISAGAIFDTDVNDGNPETLLGFAGGRQVGDMLFVHTIGYSVPTVPVENPGPWVSQGTGGIRSRVFMRIATADANDNYTVKIGAGDTSTYMFIMRASNGNPLILDNQGADHIATEVAWNYNNIAVGAANDTMVIYHGGRNVPNNNGATGISSVAGDAMEFFTVLASIIRVRSGAIQRERLGFAAFKFQEGPPVAVAAGVLTVAPAEFNGDTRGQSLRYKTT